MQQDIIDFWFKEIEPALWWKKDEAFDQLITQRFSAVYTSACQCELYGWRDTAHGRLAEIILLDQFSRNMFRNSALAFANDSLALALAQEAITAGAEEQLSPVERSFLYLPFMHSESLRIHEQAVTLYEKNGIAENLDFELKHKAIIERFGRYPHRNKALDRLSTAEELEFLRQPGSGF